MVNESPSECDISFVSSQLKEFYQNFTGVSSCYKDLKLTFVDQGTTVAGLVGYTHWNWLYIRLLWVSDECRNQKIGEKLIKRAEQIAKDRGAQHVSVDTFSPRAQAFYERLGYQVFGKLEDYPKGHSRIYLQKRDI